ncbi:glycosyltransferase family 2 protein [Sutcliffiella horikoshii]|uniref:glycosyltransferase family 2 protein n=1 Tax=Sutcliffiella horikoshii TaxID=79883 RepID=UPI003CF37222
MNKVVSIVVPIYNVERYINRCVDSLLSQTYSNLEIILVNDESPDNCPEICEEYSKIDNRVKVIHKKNGGLSDARNAGMEIANGDYIIFIDSDDYVEQNMVEKALNAAESSNSEVVIWSFFADYVDENENLLKSIISDHKPGVFSRDDFKDLKIEKKLIGNLGYAWNKMYNRHFLNENNFKFTKGLSLVEDIVFNSSVLSICKKIVFIGDPLVHYMQRPRETLGNKFYENYFQIKQNGIRAVESLLKAWGQEDKVISSIVASLGFGALKTTIRSLSVEGNFSDTQKRKFLNKLFQEPEVKEMIKGLNSLSFKDKVICILVKLKQSIILLNFYKIFQ